MLTAHLKARLRQQGENAAIKQREDRKTTQLGLKSPCCYTPMCFLSGLLVPRVVSDSKSLTDAAFRVEPFKLPGVLTPFVIPDL